MAKTQIEFANESEDPLRQFWPAYQGIELHLTNRLSDEDLEALLVKAREFPLALAKRPFFEGTHYAFKKVYLIVTEVVIKFEEVGLDK